MRANAAKQQDSDSDQAADGQTPPPETSAGSQSRDGDTNSGRQAQQEQAASTHAPEPAETGAPQPGQASDASSAAAPDAATEHWLRRIPDDPGGLLRRKFIHQYRQRAPRSEPEEQPW
jgi:Ca-activated chloride channel family protein